MNQPVVVERFHALDATRSFALLLGVVFHVAWCFVPRNAGTPTTDVSASIGFDYFFYTAHIFRMQVFFLIAGFFGRMMYHRRGPLGFVKNRLSRIAVPLVLFWIVLAPLTILTWVWGANRSGQNLTEVPLSLMIQLMQMGKILIPPSDGGLFTIAHLWFLYYLLALYAVVLVLRLSVLRLIPRKADSQRRADTCISWCVKSPWSLVCLGVLTGLILFMMQGWWGVDTPSRSYQPSLPVLLLYGFFFCFGWLLHRQTGLLSQFIPHWRWQLGLGVALSVMLFAGFLQAPADGTAALRAGLCRAGSCPAWVGAGRDRPGAVVRKTAGETAAERHRPRVSRPGENT